jgi:hypothetical protein
VRFFGRISLVYLCAPTTGSFCCYSRYCERHLLPGVAVLPGDAQPDAVVPGDAQPDAVLPGTAHPDAVLPAVAHPDAVLPGAVLPGTHKSLTLTSLADCKPTTMTPPTTATTQPIKTRTIPSIREGIVILIASG